MRGRAGAAKGGAAARSSSKGCGAATPGPPGREEQQGRAGGPGGLRGGRGTKTRLIPIPGEGEPSRAAQGLRGLRWIGG